MRYIKCMTFTFSFTQLWASSAFRSANVLCIAALHLPLTAASTCRMLDRDSLMSDELR